MISKILPGQDFKGQGHYSKVTSRSHHDVAQLYPPTNIPTKFTFLHQPVQKTQGHYGKLLITETQRELHCVGMQYLSLTDLLISLCAYGMYSNMMLFPSLY